MTMTAPASVPPALVPITDAAQELGIGRNTAYRLAKQNGELVPGVPVIKIGGLLKVTRSQLDRFRQDGFRRNPYHPIVSEDSPEAE